MQFIVNHTINIISLRPLSFANEEWSGPRDDVVYKYMIVEYTYRQYLRLLVEAGMRTTLLYGYEHMHVRVLSGKIIFWGENMLIATFYLRCVCGGGGHVTVCSTGTQIKNVTSHPPT